MSGDRSRFECIAEPTDTWLVFDNESEVPATLSEILLMSLSEDEAVSACALLNRMERQKREVHGLA